MLRTLFKYPLFIDSTRYLTQRIYCISLRNFKLLAETLPIFEYRGVQQKKVKEKIHEFNNILYSVQPNKMQCKHTCVKGKNSIHVLHSRFVLFTIQIRQTANKFRARKIKQQNKLSYCASN